MARPGDTDLPSCPSQPQHHHACIPLSSCLETTTVALHSPFTHVFPYCEEKKNSYVILTLYPGGNRRRPPARPPSPVPRSGRRRPARRRSWPSDTGAAPRNLRPRTLTVPVAQGGFVVGATPRKRAQTKRARVSAHGDVSCGCACMNFPPHSPPARSTSGALVALLVPFAKVCLLAHTQSRGQPLRD